MPPHCDSLDGPVVVAARRALDRERVEEVLPFVHEEGAGEVRRVFDVVLPVRQQGGACTEIADLHFFETVVRVHRAGEKAPYTGLKPAGLDVGPVIPLAEKAVETGDPRDLIAFMDDQLDDQVRNRLAGVKKLADARNGTVEADREYVEAMLGFVVYSHRLFKAMEAESAH